MDHAGSAWRVRGYTEFIFSKRRALQHWVQLRLEKALKDQDVLQKSWSKMQDEPSRLELLEQMHQATIQLKGLYAQFLDAGAFERLVYLEAFAAYSAAQDAEPPSPEDAQALQTKSLVAALNRRVPDWQEKFRAANEKSLSRYRSHALLQTLTGIRPTDSTQTKISPEAVNSEALARALRHLVLSRRWAMTIGLGCGFLVAKLGLTRVRWNASLNWSGHRFLLGLCKSSKMQVAARLSWPKRRH